MATLSFLWPDQYEPTSLKTVTYYNVVGMMALFTLSGKQALLPAWSGSTFFAALQNFAPDTHDNLRATPVQRGFFSQLASMIFEGIVLVAVLVAAVAAGIAFIPALFMTAVTALSPVGIFLIAATVILVLTVGRVLMVEWGFFLFMRACFLTMQ